MLPKVSVIIPIYNVREYLEKAITSVVNQTFKELEIICVNNGASEEEALIINKFASEDSRIKVITFEQNQGYGKAVNAGIESASGEYIAILESDDYINNNAFEELYLKAKEFNVDIIKSNYIALDGLFNKKGVDGASIPQNKIFTLLENAELLSKHPSIWSCLYSREFLQRKNIKFKELKGTAWVDNPFQVETLLKAASILYIDEAYYNYRILRPHSASTLEEGILVPMNATQLVHEILESNKVESFEIFKQLAKREMAYIKEILSWMSFKNIKDAEKAVNYLFEIIGTNLDDDKKFLKLKIFQ